MKSIKAIRGDENLLLIYWVITNYCNFSCSYCPPHLHSGSDVSLQPPREVLLDFCSKVKALSSSKKIELELAGGEPTTHPDFKEILSSFGDRIYVGVTTNGSRPTNWWRTIERLPNRVVISVHDETNMERILETTEFLLDRNVNVLFNCSMNAENWEMSISRFEMVRSLYGWRANPKVINSLKNGRQDQPQKLSPEQRQYLTSFYYGGNDPRPDHTKRVLEERDRMAGGIGTLIFDDDSTMEASVYVLRGRVIRNDLNRFHGWNCHAGMETISINPIGEVKAGLCYVSKIGHISDFKLPTKPVVCNRQICPCPGDVAITKNAPNG